MNRVNIIIVSAALAAAAPAWAQAMDMHGMDMAGTAMPAAPASAPAGGTRAPAQSGSMPGMNMPGMGMPPSAPEGGKAAPAPTKRDAANAMHDMPGMEAAKAAAIAAPAAGPRNADAHSGGYTLTTGPYLLPGVRPPRLADQEDFGSVLVDRLEKAYSRDHGSSTAYDIQAWFGRDFDRLVVKAEGDAAQGRLQDARTELLWGHAVAAFWDAQAGIRHDNGDGPDRNWLALGLQGLAPYWFDVEATAYVGQNGRSALRLASSYDLLLTQRWVLQPRVEANLYGKDDPRRAIGSGLSDATAGLRLRYEFTRQFAPYVGVEWNGKFGRSADFARAAGEPANTTAVVAGLRFWF